MIKTPCSWCGCGSQGTKDWRGVTGQGRAVTESGRKAGGLGSGSGIRGGRGCAERSLGARGALPSGWAPAPGREVCEPRLGLVRPCPRAAVRGRPLSEVVREALSAPPSSSETTFAHRRLSPEDWRTESSLRGQAFCFCLLFIYNPAPQLLSSAASGF